MTVPVRARRATLAGTGVAPDPVADTRSSARRPAPTVAAILEYIFAGRAQDFELWRAADEATRRLLWEARTERIKLSTFAEQFFRRLAQRLGHAMLFRKGELHRLVEYLPVERIPDEVADKLDLVAGLFAGARCEESETG